MILFFSLLTESFTLKKKIFLNCVKIISNQFHIIRASTKTSHNVPKIQTFYNLKQKLILSFPLLTESLTLKKKIIFELCKNHF